MTTFRFLSVEDWDGTWVRPPVFEQPLDPEGYLHHTAGNPYYDLTAEQAFQRLNDIAQNEGMSFLDYDALVHWEKARDIVTIGEGRGKYLSAATRDRNELGEAVVVFGYFHPPSGPPDHYSYRYSEHPNWRHIEGAARAFVWLREEGLVKPNFTLLGHRENPAHLGATGCPGDYWYPGPIQEVRNRIGQYQPSEVVVSELTFRQQRILDTRVAPLGNKTFPGQVITLGAPAGALGVKVNVTAVNPSSKGFVTVYPYLTPRPETSALNTWPGVDICNQIDTATAAGRFNLYVSVETHLLVDLVGFWS